MNKLIVLENDNETKHFLENNILPTFDEGSFPKFLSINENSELVWKTISLYNENIDIDSLFIKDNRIGLGRIPLHQYKFDIALHENKVETGLHIGDGTYGFSLGNGSNNGFIPQIIGMSKNKDESALYFVGRSGDKDVEPSDIAMFTFDCRNIFNNNIINRPLFGIKINGDENYKLLLDDIGNLHVNDIILQNKNIKSIIRELIQEELNK
ncbi:MAG: hypothetical protein RSC92_04170 [Clostridia bacterium]